MERETVLLVTAVAVCGPLTGLMGLLPAVARWPASGLAAERVAWRRLWVSLAPAALVVAALVGWAVREPDPSDERFHVALALAAAPWALLWVRAGVRSFRSLCHRQSPLAATSGLLRPKVHVSPRLAKILEPVVLAAVHEHEAAHARHRDPLRMWLAQMAADLQWPSPSAARRFSDWRHALELARDEEARTHGVDGADLAEAILATARSASGWRVPATGLTGDPARLRDRIHRLLAPVAPDAPDESRAGRYLIVVLLLGGALGVGIAHGEALIRFIPGVQS